MNPAMFLTGSRLLTGPLFLLFFLIFKEKAVVGNPSALMWLNLALITVILLELSDAFDGMVARARKEVTPLGKIFDPICDAISRQTIFLAFLLTNLIPFWMFLVFLYRDSLVYLLRIMVAKEGIVMAASKAGKFKAITQAVATFVIIVLVYLQLWGVRIGSFVATAYAPLVMLVPVFFTVQSGYEYFKNNWAVIVKMSQPEKNQ